MKNINLKYIFSFIIFWIVLTERINLCIILLGLLLSSLIYIFNSSHISNLSIRSGFSLKKTYHVLLYIVFLLKEIIIANFHVAKIVLSKKMDISPQTITFNTKLKTNIYKTILANSITLTPGTLTVQIEDNTLKVHCLKREYMNNVLNSKFEKILLKLEE